MIHRTLDCDSQIVGKQTAWLRGHTTKVEELLRNRVKLVQPQEVKQWKGWRMQRSQRKRGGSSTRTAFVFRTASGLIPMWRKGIFPYRTFSLTFALPSPLLCPFATHNFAIFHIGEETISFVTGTCGKPAGQIPFPTLYRAFFLWSCWSLPWLLIVISIFRQVELL